MKAFAAALLSLMFLTASALTAAEPRHALLMAVWEYTNPEFFGLREAESDMLKMAEKLRRMGFEVDVVMNPRWEAARRAIDEFGNALERDKGIGLFYFSGYAAQLAGRNYLIPADSSVSRPSDLELEAIPLDRVLMRMEEADNTGNLVLLDTSTNNPGQTKAHSGLAPAQSQGVVVAFSQLRGVVAGPASDNVFIEALLQRLDTPGISAQDMLWEVNKSVKEKTEYRRHIELYSAQRETFELVPRGMPTSAPPPGPTALPTKPEMKELGPQSELDRQMQKLKTGTIAFNTPEAMTFEKARLIHLVLSPKAEDASVQGKVAGSGTIVTAPARYSHVVEARLAGEAFKITSASATRQPVSDVEPTEWRWQVVPQVPGSHQLYLSIYAVVLVDGERHERLLKTFERKLNVTVSFSQNPMAFLKHRPEWAMAGMGIVVMGVAAVLMYTRLGRRVKASGGSWRSVTQPLKVDVFVSYSSKDRLWVMEFVKALRSRTVTVWMDQGGIVPAAFWAEQISQALSGATVVALVGSKHSFASHNVAKELSLASAQQKIILPIILDKSEVPDLLAYQLAGIQLTHINPSDLAAAVNVVMSMPALRASSPTDINDANTQIDETRSA